jgi:predicted small lipoprotein YifL
MLSACGKMGELYLPDDSLDSQTGQQETVQQKKKSKE